MRAGLGRAGPGAGREHRVPPLPAPAGGTGRERLQRPAAKVPLPGRVPPSTERGAGRQAAWPCRAVPFSLPAEGTGGAGRCRVAVPGAAEPGVPAGGGAARSMEKLNKLAVPAGEKLRYGLGPPQTPPRVGRSGAAGHMRARSAAGSRGAASCTGGETLGGL